MFNPSLLPAGNETYGLFVTVTLWTELSESERRLLKNLSCCWTVRVLRLYCICKVSFTHYQYSQSSMSWKWKLWCLTELRCNERLFYLLTDRLKFCQNKQQNFAPSDRRMTNVDADNKTKPLLIHAVQQIVTVTAGLTSTPSLLLSHHNTTRPANKFSHLCFFSDWKWQVDGSSGQLMGWKSASKL